MAFLPGGLRYLAAWLLPKAGTFTAVSPPELHQQLRELAHQAFQSFCEEDYPIPLAGISGLNPVP